MKKFLWALLALSITVALCITGQQIAAQNVSNYNEQGGARTVIGGTLDVVSGGELDIESGGNLKITGRAYWVPTDTPPTTTEGATYWDDSENAMKHYDGSSWVAITAGSGDNTLDDAYDQGGAGAGKKVDVDTGAVELEVDDGSNNPALHLDCDDATNDPTALLIENAADAANAITIDIDAQSTGRDIEGTGATWYVTGAGVLTVADLQATTATVSSTLTQASVVFPNGGQINNDTNNEIEFAENSEEVSFAFTSNTVTLATDTAVDTFGFGDVDALTGVGSIAFDAAAANITLTADGAADDLTISVAGAQDSSLVISSAGTAADAMQLTTSAGGIDITNGGAAGGEDLDILSSNASINLIAREDDADAIVIATTGGGGTSESINIQNDSGTAESAIDIDATAGGIDIDFATGKNMAITGGQFIVTSNENVASAINLVTNTGVSETIVATNTQGTGEAAITLTSTAGGVDIDAAAAKNVDIAGGQVLLASKDDAASAISLTANVGTSETIVVTNTQGTGTGAVTLTATAGGVDIDAAAAKDVDIAGGQVALASKDDAASAISLTTNVGTSETIVLTNTQGTDAAAVNLTATAGGITLTTAATKGVTLASDLYVKKGSDIASPAGGELDLTSGLFFDITGTNNITSIAAADSVAGRLIVLQFDGILTFTDGNNLKIAGNFVTSADDTITLICDGTNWWEMARSAN